MVLNRTIDFYLRVYLLRERTEAGSFKALTLLEEFYLEKQPHSIAVCDWHKFLASCHQCVLCSGAPGSLAPVLRSPQAVHSGSLHQGAAVQGWLPSLALEMRITPAWLTTSFLPAGKTQGAGFWALPGPAPCPVSSCLTPLF